MSDFYSDPIVAPITAALVVGTPTGSISGNDVTLAALNQEVIIDTLGAPSLLLQVSGTFVGTFLLQCSNSPSGPWFSTVMTQNSNMGGFAEVTNFTAAGLGTAVMIGRYVKFLCNAYTSGSIVVEAFLSKSVFAARGVWATISTGSNVALTANTNNNSTALFRRLATADTNLAVVKASAGKILGGSVHNLTAAVKYLKLYNKTTAPVIGTDTPVMTIPIPVNNVITIGDIFSAIGGYFSTGIAIAITGGVADADATALAANDVVLNLTYV